MLAYILVIQSVIYTVLINYYRRTF